MCRGGGELLRTPKRMIRCTRLTLSRRDQHLGFVGPVVRFPIVHQHLGSSDTVVSWYQPANLINDLLTPCG